MYYYKVGASARSSDGLVHTPKVRNPEKYPELRVLQITEFCTMTA